MSLLIFFVLLSIGVSFVCSMLEAIILSVTPSYLESLAKSRPKLYEQVKSLKDDIECVKVDSNFIFDFHHTREFHHFEFLNNKEFLLMKEKK